MLLNRPTSGILAGSRIPTHRARSRMTNHLAFASNETIPEFVVA